MVNARARVTLGIGLRLMLGLGLALGLGLVLRQGLVLVLTGMLQFMGSQRVRHE